MILSYVLSKKKKVNLDLILAIIEFAFNNYFKLKKEL
jgi:hypothetical protein